MESALSLPAWIYDNEEFLELEKEHVFMPHWHLVCHESDIPKIGDFETFTVLDQDVFVVRDNHGKIGAFYNVCRHRGSRLLPSENGNCNGKIVCPYHAWCYNCTGDLVRVPFIEEYKDFDQSENGLRTVEFEIFLGFVFVRFRPGGPSVEQSLEPIISELALYQMEDVKPITAKSSQQVAVNWKNGTDNYIDGLHIRVAHPGLNSLLNTTYRLEQVCEGIHRLSGNVEQIVGRSTLAKRYHQVLPDVAHLPPTHKRMWLYYMTWPNLAFNLYPDQVEFMQFLPIDKNHTVLRFGAYALHDEREQMTEARELNISINSEVGDEDRQLTLNVQRGMGTGTYVQGPLGHNETCLRGFADHMRQVLPVSNEMASPPVGEVRRRNEEYRGAD